MQIEILIYDGCLGSEVFAFADTLTMANALDSAGKAQISPVFKVRLVSIDAKPCTLAGGVTSISSVAPGNCDLLVVPGMEFGDREALVARAIQMRSEHSIISRHWNRGRQVATICVGAFLAAASGIAKGRSVATGWPVASLLPTIDPSVNLKTDALVVTDGRLRTTGAVTASYDLALDIVTGQMGDDIALRLRRILLLEPHRLGQNAFVALGNQTDPQLTPVHRAKTYLRDNLARPFSLAEVASAAGTSVRTLQRNFKRQTGLTPLSFHQQLRIDRAKQLLAATKLPVSHISAETGYVEEAAFRTLFRKTAGLTPGEYRRRFAILKT
jgi:transcriptional regulator GlxA family with amidase domain